jgi:superfamily II RNA helicase
MAAIVEKEMKFPEIYENSEYFDWWSFELSDWQKWALKYLLDGKNVIVKAPTGSGKTLPADFSIKYYTKHKKKVIYCSPIKALTNEKYYNFKEKYPHISFGIITGDNTDNPEADVLCMTTECYVNTLYKMKMIKETLLTKEKLCLDFDINIEEELGVLILDEIHWISDKHRGHVWEEAIMGTPKTVQILGLSATVSKIEKLMKLMSNSNEKDTMVCGCNNRAVKLYHYSFMSYPESAEKKFNREEKDYMGNMRENLIPLKIDKKLYNENYVKIEKFLRKLYLKKIRVDKFYVLNQLMKQLKKDDGFPAICFVYSRKGCSKYANKITEPLYCEDKTPSIVPGIIEKECRTILIKKFTNWKEYVALPEFQNIVRNLKKGIAHHHGGVLQPFREMIEQLFLKGYIKIVFATSSLGVGIDMPCKTTIFTSLQKFDGSKFSYLEPHEVTQAAGRAGRRGRDTKGVCIHLNNLFDILDANPTASIYEELLSGRCLQIKSRFAINFNLILKLLLSGDNNFEKMKMSLKNGMINDEIQGESKYVTKKIMELYEKMREFHVNKQNYLTDENILKEFHELKGRLNYCGKNKRRKAEIKMSHMENDYENLKSDYLRYTTEKRLSNEIIILEKKNENIKKHVENELCDYIKILEKNKFLEYEVEEDIEISGPESNLLITEKGKLAANMKECHSLVMSEFIVDNKELLKDMTAKDLAIVFSIFTNIRVKDDEKARWYEAEISEISRKGIKKINGLLDKYYDIETKNKTNFWEEYNVHYDMCEFISGWCDAETEQDCRVIYNAAKNYDIFLGDFQKAIFKIVNIVHEIEKVGLLLENLELMNKLSIIPNLLLKSVAINQSLYL